MKATGKHLSRHNGLSSEDIDSYLRNVKSYHGWYCKDKIPKNLKNGWYVINMQNSTDGDGTHWVCMKYSPNLISYYDPFGVAPPLEVLKKANHELIYNTIQIQDEKSTACGFFCIACILCDYSWKMKPYDFFKYFLSYFSSNTIQNDLILKKMLN